MKKRIINTLLEIGCIVSLIFAIGEPENEIFAMSDILVKIVALGALTICAYVWNHINAEDYE